jgi:hypothetical protein
MTDLSQYLLTVKTGNKQPECNYLSLVNILMKVRGYLISLARSHKTVSYETMNRELEMGFDMKVLYHRQKLQDYLDIVSKAEQVRGRPLLGSLIRKEEDKNNADMKKHSEECFEFWNKQENYDAWK